VAAAAAHQPSSWCRGKEIAGGGHCPRGKGGERRRAVGRRHAVQPPYHPPEVVAIQRFRRPLGEERGGKQLLNHGVVDPSGRGQPAPGIHRLSGMGAGPVVEQGVARPGVKGEHRAVLVIPGADPGDVRHPAHVEHRQRARHAGGERHVIQRRQGCPLAAHRDVGGAELEDHGNAQGVGEELTVAELPSLAPIRAVQHRLAVKAHHVHVRRRQTLRRHQPPHRLHMAQRQLAADGRRAGPRPAPQQRPQAIAKGVVIGLQRRRSEPLHPTAVGDHQRRIDAIEGRAAHQADGGQRRFPGLGHGGGLLTGPVPVTGRSLCGPRRCDKPAAAH